MRAGFIGEAAISNNRLSATNSWVCFIDINIQWTSSTDKLYILAINFLLVNSYRVTTLTLKVIHSATFSITSRDISEDPFVNALSLNVAESVSILNALPTISLSQLLGFKLSLCQGSLLDQWSPSFHSLIMSMLSRRWFISNLIFKLLQLYHIVLHSFKILKKYPIYSLYLSQSLHQRLRIILAPFLNQPNFFL